jgi:hypothetical protein
METYHSKSDELANLQMVCMAQLTIRLTNLAAKLGHCPSVIEMMAGDEHGPITYAAIKWAFNMTAREALRSIGLNVGLPGSAKGANSIADSKRLKILQMRSRGSSYREICAALDVSIPTAMKYVSLAS